MATLSHVRHHLPGQIALPVYDIIDFMHCIKIYFPWNISAVRRSFRFPSKFPSRFPSNVHHMCSNWSPSWEEFRGIFHSVLGPCAFCTFFSIFRKNATCDSWPYEMKNEATECQEMIPALTSLLHSRTAEIWLLRTHFVIFRESAKCNLQNWYACT